MSLGRSPAFAAGTLLTAFLAALPAGAGAQEVSPALTGRLDAAAVWSQSAPETLTGLSTGWAALTGGTSAVKSELRLTLTNLPSPAVGLGRAWLKFRQPGWRVTAGLGRVGWGPGFVFVPGDLLNDSTSSPADWTADELRSDAVWLADAWLSLGEEAFAEAAVRSTAGGLRLSAAPFGVTVEASGLWDQAARRASGALSVQGPLLGLDWYATGRADASPAAGTLAGQLSGGVFGLWQPGEGWVLSTRHEGLAGTDSTARTWRTFHSLSAGCESWTLTGRGLSGPAWSSWSLSADLAWAALQGLTLRASAVLTEPRSFGMGATARW